MTAWKSFFVTEFATGGLPVELPIDFGVRAIHRKGAAAASQASERLGLP